MPMIAPPGLILLRSRERYLQVGRGCWGARPIRL